jgi:hypothetical protein
MEEWKELASWWRQIFVVRWRHLLLCQRRQHGWLLLLRHGGSREDRKKRVFL